MNALHETFIRMHNDAADRIQSRNISRLDSTMISDLIQLRAAVNIYGMVAGMATTLDLDEFIDWLTDRVISSVDVAGGNNSLVDNEISYHETRALANALKIARLEQRVLAAESAS